MNPDDLRVMADAYDQKAAQLFDAGRFAEADQAWDNAITLRVRANEQDNHTTRPR